MIADSFETWMI